MKQQQQQLAMLEEAMKSRKQVELLTEETNKLKEKLSIKQTTLNRLQKLCLASSSLLGSVDSTAQETELSSLHCLSKLEQSTAINPTEKEDQDDQVKLIVGKYLNQLLAVLVDFAEQNTGNLNILSLLKLEQKLSGLFLFAEQKEIIPETDDSQSWKKSVAQHQELFEKINQIMNQEDEGNEEQ